MFVSISFTTPPSYFLNCVLDAAKIGVFTSHKMSSAKCVLEACMCIGKPSKRFRKSAQSISLSFHLRSFKKITFAFSAPTQANVPETGEKKHLNTSVSGFRASIFQPFPRSDKHDVVSFAATYLQCLSNSSFKVFYIYVINKGKK